MMLVNSNLNLEIELEENVATVVIAENPDTFANLSGDIWRQLSGEEGQWILSNNNKEIRFDKNVECIYNPFAIECNNKKLLNVLYKNFANAGKEGLIEETCSINRQIIQYLDKLLEKETYGFSYALDLDITGLLKLYDVRIDTETDSLADTVVSYMSFQYLYSFVLAQCAYYFLQTLTILIVYQFSSILW